jgi:hypothetical protein
MGDLGAAHIRERLAGTAIRSITQPLLVLSLGFSLPALALAHFLSGIALYFDIGLAVLFPALFSFTHIFFVFREPDRLQSEDYRLRDRSLSMLETNGGRVSDAKLLAPSRSPKPIILELSDATDPVSRDGPEFEVSTGFPAKAAGEDE